jgi:hypothetical protein
MKLKIPIILCCLFLIGTAWAQDENKEEPKTAPVNNFSVHLETEDGVRTAFLQWEIPATNGDFLETTEYVVLRGLSKSGPFEERGRISNTTTFFEDIVEMDTTVADSLIPDPPEPIQDLNAIDRDNDHGHGVVVSWNKSPDEGDGRDIVIGYEVFRADTTTARFKSRRVILGTYDINDIGGMYPEERDYMPDYVDYFYKVRALTMQYRPGEKSYIYKIRSLSADTLVFTDCGTAKLDLAVYADSEIFGPVQCYGQWFNMERLAVLLMVTGFLFLTVFFIQKARGGAKLFVRRLAGIEAVDEAIGRATEMGKPILYVLGLGTAADIATIASYTILGRVAKKVAEYQTGLIVPCYDPIVMTVAQETVKTAYLDAGRPDAYKEDMVYFVTNQQFAYVAGVNGVMLRERPATNLYMGKFYAESLILAETGTVAGSIQISGTDEISQIPFFVVACDYALIGEELYAASAYLGKEPLLLGSLKAQDYAKAGVIFLAIIGFITLMLGYHGIVDFFHVAG